MPDWQKQQDVVSRSYTCGFCGNVVASAKGYANSNSRWMLRICPHCGKPTFHLDDSQTPGVAPGNDVRELPEDVDGLYREARNATAVAAYTASVLACRKLLMNIAVSQGAKPGESFVSYIEYLANAGFVPPNGKGWVDHIRTKGNEATHEIKLMTLGDAEDLLAFSEMLLKFIYEFPSRVPIPKST
jgi:hypothetical protein